MKRILINATHAEEIRVALCKEKHVYDFDLENRTREQKKSNIYKGHITRVEPSLEAVFVEYGSERQGFLSIREIASEYLSGDPRKTKNIRDIISEGTELLVQVQKEERGNKGAALSTYMSLAGRYLVLMPNNASGGGISRQISGSVRDEMKRLLGQLKLPKGMSVIVRTAGICKTQEQLQNDLDYLLGIWSNINQKAQKTPSPCLTHREAGVVTRAVRDYLKDDIAEVWIDNEQAYNEAYHFVQAVMPTQLDKIKKYLDIEPMFTSFGIESQIETAYQREVHLPSGGSIVIDQTEALVSIDINSAKSIRGADIEATAHNTNLEAADEIARQLRLRDMGGLVVIDFIDMLEEKHRKDVENRMKNATQHDRARIQLTNISRFGLLEMSRQRLRPSLEEATGFKCPRCHGNGIIRDLPSLSLSIMRNIEKIALKKGRGEVQAEVPIEIGAFLLNEKRDALVYLEQDSGARITILPHSHLKTPQFNITFNQDGFAPSSYERVNDTRAQQTENLGYDTDWQTQTNHTQQRQKAQQRAKDKTSKHKNQHYKNKQTKPETAPEGQYNSYGKSDTSAPAQQPAQQVNQQAKPQQNDACAWLSNLFTPPVQARTIDSISSSDAAAAIEQHINSGATSRGVEGSVNSTAQNVAQTEQQNRTAEPSVERQSKPHQAKKPHHNNKKPYDKRSKYKGDKAASTKEASNKETNKEINKEAPRQAVPRREDNNNETRSQPRERDRNKDVKVNSTPTESTGTAHNNKTHNKQSARPQAQANATHDNQNRASQPAKKDVAAPAPKGNNASVQKKPHQNKQQVVVNVTEKSVTDEPSQHVNIDVATGNVEKTVLNKAVSTSEPKKAAPKAQTETVQKAVVTDTSKKELVQSSQPIVKTEVTETTPENLVPANQWGRAKNDPRELHKPTAVTGTALSFVTNHFGESAQKQIQEHGLIITFIKALNSQKNVTVTSVVISEKTIAEYRKSILPVAHFACVAGTASVNAPTPSFRAVNDSRGQIEGHTTVPLHLQVAHLQTVHTEQPTVDNTVTDTTVETSQQLQVETAIVEEITAETLETEVASDNKTETRVEPVVVAVDPTKPIIANQKNPVVVDLKGKTAGEFVHQCLGESAAEIIANQSFVTAFLTALASVSGSADTEQAQVTKPVAKKPAKPKKPKATRQRTSKKATADKVTVTKKTDASLNEISNNDIKTDNKTQ